MHKWVFGLLMAGMFLAACSAAEATRLPTTALPTHSATPAPSATATDSPAPTASSTATPTLSATPSRTPTLTPTSRTPGCGETHGRIETGEFKVRDLRMPLKYRVYVPPCYDQETTRRYPTLYLFHGQGFTDDQWDRMGADETADRLISQGEIPPLLIIMPYERYGGQPDQTAFSDSIMYVLLPYIDENYRTLADRAHRAVGGLSRGAGWSVHLGFTQPNYFSAVGAHSPAVFYYDAQRMRTWLPKMPDQLRPRVYIDIGDRDRPEIMDSAVWLSQVLDQYEVDHEWHLFSGYHNEEYWSSHMEQYLRWYTQDW